MESTTDHPSRPLPVTLAADVVPRQSGWFFSKRLPDPLESHFRADYRCTFIRRMQSMWLLCTFVWLVATLLDRAYFQESAGRLVAWRYAGLAILAATTIALFFPFRLRDRVHVLTSCSSAAVGLVTAGLFASLPYPQNNPFFWTISTVAVVSTVFVTTLHFEYSALASVALIAEFAVAAVFFSSAPLVAAVAFTLGLTAILFFSLACTHTIEGYARENFAQRVALELQSAAIREKADQLAISEATARDANLAKSVFLSNMSHELRTPLNAVLGFAQLMHRDRSLPAHARDKLRIIEQSGDHLLALINDVLAISKIEAGRLTLVEQPFDLHETLNSVGDMVRVRTDAKGLQFIVTLEPDLPRTVVGDVGKLRQVLVNLLGNAVKFTETGGVSLRASWTGTSAVVEVEDTGYGIAPEEIGRLFEAFAQTESGRKSTEGTGLGLAISRNFARLMGGDIRVRSELDRGTTFTLELPLALCDAIEMEPRTRRISGLAPGEPAYRILIVDDASENRLLLRTIHEEVGFDIREASNGAEAVDAWRDWRPHLIWMDMRMPVMDGYEATLRIRQLETDAACRIIALTASAFQHDRDEILANGCDDFVTKPFRHSTIFEKLEEHLGVRFVVEEDVEPDAATDAVTTDGGRLADRLASLPGELRERLRAALQLGDVAAASGVCAEIGERDAPIAQELQKLIRAYSFDDVLDAMS